MIVFLCLAVFLYVVGTGPAGAEWRTRRRARRMAELDAPMAKVLYLPSAACRQDRPQTDTFGEFLTKYGEYLDGKRAYEDLPLPNIRRS